MNIKEKHQKMLYPAVRITSDAARGSGTILYSQQDKEDEDLWIYYILTNEHVIDDLIEIKKKWSNIFKRKIEQDILGTPEVETFAYKWGSRVEGSTSWKAKIIAYDKEEDLALLKMKIPFNYKYVAKLYPASKVKDLQCFMETITVGCGLGEKPVITAGFLSGFGYEIDNKEFLMNTAPSIFGNSGGSTFLKETGEFIGVPSRISVTMVGYSADPITHIGYIIPCYRVYKFLKDQYYQFIFDSNFTSEQCGKLRKEAREQDELKMLKRLKSDV